MKERTYTKDELKRLLGSDEISDQFRTAIMLALEDGSDDAIRALGAKGATALPPVRSYPVSP